MAPVAPVVLALVAEVAPVAAVARVLEVLPVVEVAPVADVAPVAPVAAVAAAMPRRNVGVASVLGAKSFACGSIACSSCQSAIAPGPGLPASSTASGR